MAAKKRKLCGDSGQITAKGTPCGNPVKKGTDKCGAHAGSTGAPAKRPTDTYVVESDGTKRSYTEIAAAYASIGMTKHRIARDMRMAPATISGWWERGEADFEENVESEFRDFYLQLEHGRAAFVRKALTRLDAAAKDGEWRANIAQLQLVLRDEFGPKATVEHSGEINLVERHAEQLLTPLMAILDELGVVDDPRVPNLIEKHYASLERT